MIRDQVVHLVSAAHKPEVFRAVTIFYAGGEGDFQLMVTNFEPTPILDALQNRFAADQVVLER